MNKLWAIKMLFLWRYRLGYWAWDAFKVAWQLPKLNCYEQGK